MKVTHTEKKFVLAQTNQTFVVTYKIKINKESFSLFIIKKMCYSLVKLKLQS